MASLAGNLAVARSQPQVQGCRPTHTFAVASPMRPNPARDGRRKRRAVGRDAAQPWLDVTKFVTGGAAKGPFVDLANEFGDYIYIDINGWHLYLKDIRAGPDANLAVALADKLGPVAGEIKEADIEGLLKAIPVKLGQGKAQVSLYDCIPSMGLQDLSRILEKFSRK